MASPVIHDPTCCLECGALLPPSGGHRQKKFCTVDCKKAFNNREAMRGTELYRFFMASRYQRRQFPDAITIMAQMAREWRDEDKVRRDGRPSWTDISHSMR